MEDKENIKNEEKSEVSGYINRGEIEKILSNTIRPSEKKVKDIITKALELEGLLPREAAALLQIEDQDLIEEFLQAAREVKEQIYGKRLVLFAPLYFANRCENNCLYCAFRRDNDQVQRKKLTPSEIKKEVEALEKAGHKRLLVLTGEEESTDLDYLIESIETCYHTKTDHGGEIRRINVEIAPLTRKQFKRLKEAKIGTYTCFQETYHRPTYNKMHPSGPKADYDWRLSVMDRAQEAGIDDVGIGALFGLYDYRFEVIALLKHAEYLDQKYGVGPHTISVPRLNPALGAPIDKPPYPVSDEEFKKLVAVLRLAVPYTGLILTTRESISMRNELFLHGVSQISAGSRTTPGGYQEDEERKHDLEQFSLHDVRPMAEIIEEVAKQDYLPSFCTACYRLGRTGKDFMDLAKPGKIQKYCKPNAMLTFKEYLVNFGTESTRESGEDCLQKHLQELCKEDPSLGQKVASKMEQIARGARDIYI
ncbi:MAG: [FeFe] hydrogenase H-cluster radical SAM maturase HydG [bacterium]